MKTSSPKRTCYSSAKPGAPKAPVVFVRGKNYTNMKPRKVLLPQTLAQLKIQVQKILNWTEPVLSLYTEDKVLIKKIEDVKDGMMIIGSKVDSDFEAPRSPDPPPKKERSHKGRSNDLTNPLTPVDFASYRQKPTTDKNDKPAEIPKAKVIAGTTKMFHESKKQAEKQAKIFLASTQKQEKPPNTENLAIALATMNKKEGSFCPFRKSGTSTKMIDLLSISRQPSSESDDDNDASTVKNPSALSRASSLFLKKAESSESEDEEIERQRKQKRAEVKAKQSILDSQPRFQRLVSELVTVEKSPKSFETAVARMPQARREFLEASQDHEGEQLYMWIHAVSDQPFLLRVPRDFYRDPIIVQATNFFVKHRAVCSGRPLYRFRGAITGPKKSGKTVTLAGFVDHFILELAANELWKSTFLFVIDMETLSPFLMNPLKIYKAMLFLTVEALGKQRPTLQKEIGKIRKQFESVTENRDPLIPKHSYPALDRLAIQLNQSWRDPDAIEAWYTNVFMLPYMMCRAVGFTHCALFVDNIEEADVEILEDSHFDVRNTVYIVEYMKYALTHTNSIVTGDRIAHFFECMTPIDEAGVDGLAGIDYITTIGVITDLGSRPNVKYLLEIQEEPEPVVLTVDMCGGVVAFIALWDQLNLRMFRLDRAPLDTDEWNESYYDAIAGAQDLVDVLFTCKKAKKITVSGIRKLTTKPNENADEN